MKGSLVCTAVLLAAVDVLAARPKPQKSEPLTEPYRPPRETVLVANGEAQAVVLIPEDSGYVQTTPDGTVDRGSYVVVDLNTDERRYGPGRTTTPEVAVPQ